jgi:hypothetical protein
MTTPDASCGARLAAALLTAANAASFEFSALVLALVDEVFDLEADLALALLALVSRRWSSSGVEVG